jgi:hypothetical protein
MLRARAAGGALLLAVLAAWVTAGPARAQSQPGQAEITKLAGRVEVLRKGQSQWAATALGARLVDGDEIRTHPGGSAELRLPDGSTLVVVENSRLVMNRLQFDARAQTRTALLHLVAGRVRASVAHAAISLVRTRQSNFAISTPTAVAAVRGTLYEVGFDAAQRIMHVAVLVRDPNRPEGLVSCASFVQALGTVLVQEGLASIATPWGGCGAPVPLALLPDAGLIGTLRNPVVPPAGALNDPVTLPAFIPGLVGAPPPVIGTGFPGIGTLAPEPPSTLGQNLQQTPASEPATQ